jgi:hypothetical protein
LELEKERKRAANLMVRLNIEKMTVCQQSLEMNGLKGQLSTQLKLMDQKVVQMKALEGQLRAWQRERQSQINRAVLAQVGDLCHKISNSPGFRV